MCAAYPDELPLLPLSTLETELDLVLHELLSLQDIELLG
jgi:hypothetical protein